MLRLHSRGLLLSKQLLWDGILEKERERKESTHSPAFVVSFQGFGIISLCIWCAVKRTFNSAFAVFMP